MVSWSYNHCHVHHGGCYKGVCRKVTNPYAVVPLLEASGYCGFWLYFIRKIWSVVTLCGRWRWRGAQKSFLRKTCKFTRSFHTFWIWMVFPEGRGFRNRCSQNPGIAKKGGGSDSCQDLFVGFIEESQKPYWGITPKLIITNKLTFSQKVIIHS